MAKKRKQTLEVNGKPKNNKLYVGKIDGNELLMNRKGKVNTGSNPEMRSHIHKSEKDYDRNREKRKTRREINSSDFFN